jgi:hypothetical protein
MKKAGIILLSVALSACNLSTQPLADAPTETAAIEAPIAAQPSVTPLTLNTNPTLAPPPIPDGATLPPGTLCQVYVTYSGSDPDNLLSLRAQPSATAKQVIKLPNRTNVFRVPNSQEMEAEGYHWLNIIYIDEAKNRFQGWTARDSFSTNGVRDPLIATLQETNQQSAC